MGSDPQRTVAPGSSYRHERATGANTAPPSFTTEQETVEHDP
jgi:hypothetical protein